MKLNLFMLQLAAASIVPATAADLYWDANGEDSGTGGTGNWGASNTWRNDTDTGALTTWTNDPIHNAILAGTAGTVTISGGEGSPTASGATASTLTVSTTGYEITSSANTRALSASSLVLGTSVALTFNMNSAGPAWTLGGISFGNGSSLLINGQATPDNSTRINFNVADTSISGGSMTLNGTAAGPTGFVGTASGVILNTNILNNSATSATMLGATDNRSLEYRGVLSGTAKLQISAGQKGGAGIVLLTNQNTYTGDTYLNTHADGVLRIGILNALPTGTSLFFAQSAGGGTADTGGTLDLNGHSQTLGALDGTGRGVVNTKSTLSTLTLGKAAGTHTFSGVIGVPATTTNIAAATNQIALVKTGASKQILAGANTYTGSTSVEGGVLVINGSISTGAVTVSSGAKLAGTGTVGGSTTIESGGKHSAGAVGVVGSQTFSNGLAYQSGSIFEWDLASANTSSGFDKVTLNGGSLTGSGEFRVVTDLDFGAAPTFWSQQQIWSTIFGGAGTLTGWSTAQAATIYSSTGTLRNLSSIGSFTIEGTTLTWNAVPEHSNVMIGGLIALGLLRRKRASVIYQ